MRVRERSRAQVRDVEIPVLAVVDHALLGPAVEHDLLDLLETLLRLVGIDLIGGVLVEVHHAAAAQPDDQPALADMVQQRELLGQSQRMIERRLENREADLDPRGHRAQRGGERRRIDVGGVAIEMMLGEEQGVDADLLGQHGLLQRLLDRATVIRRILALRKEKRSDFHDDPVVVAARAALRTHHGRKNPYHRAY